MTTFIDEVCYGPQRAKHSARVLRCILREVGYDAWRNADRGDMGSDPLRFRLYKVPRASRAAAAAAAAAAGSPAAAAVDTYDLEALCREVPGARGPPRAMAACMAELERRGLEAAGLYRVGAPRAAVSKLLGRFVRGRAAPGDAHELAGCITLLLRRLREPLLPRAAHAGLMDALRRTAPGTLKRQNAVLLAATAALSPPELATLRALCAHLGRVADAHPTTRMNRASLGLVFAPLLFRPPTAADPDAIRSRAAVVEALIGVPPEAWDDAEAVPETWEDAVATTAAPAL